MEIGQSPVDSAYTRPAPEPTQQRNESVRGETLESNQSDVPAPTSQQPTASTGSVGRNVDTYA